MKMSLQPAFWSVWVPWMESRQVIQTLPTVTKAKFHVRGVEKTHNLSVTSISTFTAEQFKYVQQLHRHCVFQERPEMGMRQI